MDETTRVRIRHLYFVERLSLAAIGEALALARHAVRGALLLPGGQTGRPEPAPLATALVARAAGAAPPNSNPPHGAPPARRRVTQRHR